MAVFKITNSRHPEYMDSYNDWIKWRYAYQGGRPFIERYLKRFSKRESQDDFDLRKEVTYSPSFAKAAVNDLKNAVYQRMTEIRRLGGPQNYQDAIKGYEGGVDKYGSPMNTFIGQDILPELLSMGKVGIFVDKDKKEDSLLTSKAKSRPYLYYFPVEDIYSWDYRVNSDNEECFYNLLLRLTQYEYDDTTGLPKGIEEVFRHFWINADNKVQVDDYKHYDDPEREDTLLNTTYLELTRIPFILPALSSSLMTDIADIQVALLNLNSSDLNYALKSNTPFYTEQFDPKSENIYGKAGGGVGPIITSDNRKYEADGVTPTPNYGSFNAGRSSTQHEFEVGATTGRRYPSGLDRPSFINPSSEPLLASMKKQEEMKQDIRRLINLGVANTIGQHASAESKGKDSESMEAGLSAIGQEIEWAENQICKIWAEYESTQPAIVMYPTKYSLKTDGDRESSAKALKDLKGAVPSKTFSKEVSKQISYTLLSGKVTDDVLTTIESEIDKANYVTSDAEEIKIDIEAGIVGPETASTARGYDGATEVESAQKYQQERLAAIAIAQTKGLGAARGIKDGPKDAKKEKKNTQDPSLNPTGGGPLTRGAAN